MFGLKLHLSLIGSFLICNKNALMTFYHRHFSNEDACLLSYVWPCGQLLKSEPGSGRQLGKPARFAVWT